MKENQTVEIIDFWALEIDLSGMLMINNSPLVAVLFIIVALPMSSFAQDLTDQEIERMKTFSPDMGDWFGIKYGASTSGGPIEDRTMFLTFYETRSGRHFSALAHFVLWRDHDGRSRVTRPSIGGGFKLRFPFKRIGFFVEAGTNVWVGLGVGILPYIDLGSEVFLNERLSFSLSAKRFAYARNKYFFLAGASYQISKMIR